MDIIAKIDRTLLLLIFCLFMCGVCIVTATVICITVTNIVVINLLTLFLNFCLFISYSYWAFTMLID